MQLAAGDKYYVVESDVTAFYEYIDHSRLLDELQLRTLSVSLPRYLIDLLTEIQGRPFGLPQLLDPSDQLSEVYARIIERELKRRGFKVWRYNDDFRLLADSYDKAQESVEALADECAAVGLVLNERKTRILKLSNYRRKQAMQPPTEGDVAFEPETFLELTPYGEENDDGAALEAQHTMDRLDLQESHVDYLDLKQLSTDDNRNLTRAIAILTSQADPYGLKFVSRIFEYAPHLTHRLGAYMVKLHENRISIDAEWEELIQKESSSNPWQRVWLVYIARKCNLLTNSNRLPWIESQKSSGDPLLRAEAFLALAPYNLVTFEEIDRSVRAEPEPLIPWYAMAARIIPGVNQNNIKALKESYQLVDILIRKGQSTK